MKPPTPKEQGMGPNSHRRRRPRSRGRVTHRGARVTIPAPYGRVTVQSAAPSSFHASASIPSHISCRCISLYLVVFRFSFLYLVVSFLSSLYVAMFLVLLGLTLSVSFLEVTLAIDELRGLRLDLLLTLSFLEVLALAKDELRLLLIPLPGGR